MTSVCRLRGAFLVGYMERCCKIIVSDYAVIYLLSVKARPRAASDSRLVARSLWVMACAVYDVTGLWTSFGISGSSNRNDGLSRANVGEIYSDSWHVERGGSSTGR